MGNSNILFESLFKSKSAAGDTQNYLSKIATEYPYFSPAQFFLLQQMNKNDEEYNLHAAKTSILFNNPYWLNFQLQENSDILKIPVEALPLKEAELFYEDQPGVLPANNNAESEEQQQNTAEAVVEENIYEPVYNNDQPLVIIPVDIPHENASINNQATPIELTGHPDNRPPTIDSEVELNNQFQNIGGPENLSNHQHASPGADVSIENNFANEEKVHELEENMYSANGESSPEDHPAEADLIERTTEQYQTTEDDQQQNTQTNDFGKNDETLPIANEQQQQEEDIEISEVESQPLNFKINIPPSTTTEETITFEPLYTTDYFASQGIKLSGDIKTNDKLGKQLKSFTEWLKTMKKVHTSQLADSGNLTDISIQKLAEKSNTEDEVVTEAMADVLVQQGKAGKAIEVYKKLSLFNPSKTAYFAAKIDQLKEQ